MNPLISARELEALGEKQCVLLDVRWTLGRDDGAQQYALGHIPSAVFVDLERELSGAVGEHTGRHPLPLPADFEAAARRWGIDDDSHVVVYDDSGALAAARAWWLLRHAGFEQVQVLDGGLEAWKQAGGAVSTEASQARTGTVSLSWDRMPVVEFDELESLAGVLIDSRATVRYLGIQEPVDPVAGHIPGALNRPTTDNLDEQARFYSPEVLRCRVDRLPIAARELPQRIRYWPRPAPGSSWACTPEVGPNTARTHRHRWRPMMKSIATRFPFTRRLLSNERQQ
ncbi:sulfurtransferase [Glutamicibacter sp.]|uniref:sulfurtransferase n=1 Tax=Glutamicibacter sp. TaxID=1931995 RepID=UPI002FE09B42